MQVGNLLIGCPCDGKSGGSSWIKKRGCQWEVDNLKALFDVDLRRILILQNLIIQIFTLEKLTLEKLTLKEINPHRILCVQHTHSRTHRDKHLHTHTHTHTHCIPTWHHTEEV